MTGVQTCALPICIIGAVGSATWAFVKTGHLCTLTDLERFILASNADFAGATSFEDLGIGKLALHPVVQRLFSLTPELVRERGTFPRITADELWEHLAEVFQLERRGHEPEFDVEAHIGAFVEEKFGTDTLAKAGIRCVAGRFLTWLLVSARKAQAKEDLVVEHRIWKSVRSNRRKSANVSGRDLLQTLKAIVGACPDFNDKYRAVFKFVSETFRVESKRVLDSLTSVLFFAVMYTPDSVSAALPFLQLAEGTPVENAVLRHVDGSLPIAECLGNMERAFLEALGAKNHSAAPQSLIGFVLSRKDLASAVNLLAGSEIGRASCRERV